jgi:hypothetical protein
MTLPGYTDFSGFVTTAFRLTGQGFAFGNDRD